jgi:siroheme synthase-like protein
VAVDPAPAGRLELEGLELRVEAYRAEHLQGASLVVAAAPPGVNRQVVADARAAGIWVNSASDPEAGDFRVPAVWRDGPLTLTVATAGASPALAGALRDRAAAALGPAAGLAAVLAEMRGLVVARLADPDARRRVLAGWGDPSWLDLFSAGGPAAVRAEVRRRLDAAAGADRPGLSEDLA